MTDEFLIDKLDLTKNGPSYVTHKDKAIIVEFFQDLKEHKKSISVDLAKEVAFDELTLINLLEIMKKHNLKIDHIKKHDNPSNDYKWAGLIIPSVDKKKMDDVIKLRYKFFEYLTYSEFNKELTEDLLKLYDENNRG